MADRKRVLVVDDRQLNLELMEAYLGDLDCEVVCAGDGCAALAELARRSFDLVLLDVMMPGIDGYEVCRRIKAGPDAHFLPVVLVSALTTVADRIAGLEAGADDFITKPVDRYELVARARSLLRLKATVDRLDDATRVMLALSRAVEAKDQFTELHVERVADWSRRLAERAGFDAAECEAVYLGGLVHDIGKIGIPDQLLSKPGPLDPVEAALMRTHVTLGEGIVKPLRSAGGVVAIVRHHHEWWDGSGYPDGLRGEEIPLAARVVAVCDAYDAMVHDRPYRTALGPQRAREVLREGAGVQWDPELVESFLQLLAEPPAIAEQLPATG